MSELTTPRPVSIAVEDNKKLFAHLTVKRRPQTNQLDLLFPAINPDQAEHLLSLSDGFWRCICHHAQRQACNSICYYNYAIQTTTQLISSRCFKSTPVAIIPHLQNVDEDGQTETRNRSLVLWWNRPDTGISTHKTLYVPVSHFSLIEALYQPWV